MQQGSIKRWLAGCVCLLLSGSAFAAGPRAVAKQVQASMLLTGSIVVTPAGKVLSYTIDKPQEIPPAVLAVIAGTVPGWTFAPVLQNGQPVTAKATMSLRVVATPVAAGNFAVSVSGASFGHELPGHTISALSRPPPRYPWDAMQDRAAGTVYLLVKVGRQGEVEDAVAEQVNLTVLGPTVDMDRWRRDFSKAAVAAARRWRFNPPTLGSHVNDPYWVARVPIKFSIRRNGRDFVKQAYGHWSSYIPGPRELVPWRNPLQSLASEPDATPDGGLQQLGSGLQRLPPRQGS